MSPRIRWTLVALAAIGLGFSAESLWVHYRLLTDPTYISPCNVNATFNCSEVYLSQYGSVGGIPVAFGGVIWFGLVASIVAFARTERPTSTAAHYVLGLSVVGLAVVAYLAYTSFVVIGSGCLLCMGTYASVLAIAAVSKFATNGSLGQLFTHLPEDLATLPSRPAGFAMGAALLVAVAAGIFTFPTERAAAAETTAGGGAVPDDVRSDFAAAWARMPRTDFGEVAKSAPVVVIKFNDFECPTCRQAEQLYAPIFERFNTSHPGQVRLVLKDYPLNSSCNASLERTIPGHEAACYAAAAARIAADHPNRSEMINWIWLNQGTTAAAMRDEAMRILGLTGPQFDQEYRDRLPAIRQDTADGAALQISGTPTYFINGVRLPSAIIQPEYFTLAIELELEKAATPE